MMIDKGIKFLFINGIFFFLSQILRKGLNFRLCQWFCALSNFATWYELA